MTAVNLSKLPLSRAAAFACLMLTVVPVRGQWAGCTGQTGSYCLPSGNAGLGTATPGAKLHVRSPGNDILSDAATGDGTLSTALGGVRKWSLYNQASNGALGIYDWTHSLFRMYITSAGNVGIGTTAPATSLEVDGYETIATGNPALIFEHTSAPCSNNCYSVIHSNAGYSANYNGLWLASNETGAGTQGNTALSSWALDVGGYDLTVNDSFNIRRRTAGGSNYSSPFFVVNSSGNVGIGTTSPCISSAPANCKLSVAGAIQAKEVVVNTGWSDYVFAPEYPLAPLSEVAAYVKENHHLPDIPSAAEVKEKGVSLGDMQAKLLAKVEELTLHMIQAEEKNKQLEGEVRELQNRIAGPGEAKQKRSTE